MRNHAAFTLVELVVVFVVIGILAAIAIPKLSGARHAAYFAAMRADLTNLAEQQETYYAETQAYASDATLLDFVASEYVTVTITASTDGWSASSSHAALASSEGCSIYYGSATPPTVGAVTPSGPGEVDCTQ